MVHQHKNLALQSVLFNVTKRSNTVKQSSNPRNSCSYSKLGQDLLWKAKDIVHNVELLTFTRTCAKSWSILRYRCFDRHVLAHVAIYPNSSTVKNIDSAYYIYHIYVYIYIYIINAHSARQARAMSSSKSNRSISQCST